MVAGYMVTRVFLQLDVDNGDVGIVDVDVDTHFWKRSIAKKAMLYIPHRGYTMNRTFESSLMKLFLLNIGT